jgi:hypothetical protein
MVPGPQFPTVKHQDKLHREIIVLAKNKNNQLLNIRVYISEAS